MRESANDVDIYWESEIEGDIHRVIVLCSQEPCPIPNILVESIEEKAELKATVFSKLDKTKPFFMSDAIIGTTIHQVGNQLIVNFRGFHPITTGNHWLFGYPIVRETIESIMDKTDVDSFLVLTSSIYTKEPVSLVSKSESTFSTWKFGDWYNDGENKDVLPLFAFMTSWLARLRGIQTDVVMFKASLDNIMSQQMFADGVGLFQIVELGVDIEKAQDLYDQHESEVDMITELMTNKDVSSGGMFS